MRRSFLTTVLSASFIAAALNAGASFVREHLPVLKRREVELSWLPDGTHMIVGRRWLLNVERAEFASTSLEAVEPNARMSLSWSPDSKQVLVLGEGRMAIGPIQGSLPPWVSIPRWVSTRDSEDYDVVNVGFWLSPDAVFIQQFDQQGRSVPACRSYDVRLSRWHVLTGGCLSSAFTYLSRIDKGPRALLALQSSAEGLHAVELVHYDSHQGQSRTRASTIEIEGSSAVQVAFRRDGSKMTVLSPCRLHGSPRRTCTEPDLARSWNQYSWSARGGLPRLLRSDIPPGSVLHPYKDHFAWMQEETICVGDASGPKRKCVPLPTQ
jgi:hypothetical protein